MSRCTTGGIEPSSSENSLGSTEISPSCRFQYVHIGWSRATSPFGWWTSIVGGSSSIAQRCLAQGPGATISWSHSMRPWFVSAARTEPSPASSKPVTSTPVISCAPVDCGLGLHAGDGVEVVREAALVLVQHGGHALRAPVREERLHVRVAGGLAGHERRVVADLLLALVDGGEVGLLRLRADRHVADRVVGVGGRIGLPDLDAGLHELLHRGLEVVVAHDAAGDAGRAGARVRLLEDHDVGARARAAGGQLLAEVVRRREAVQAGADDQVLRACGQHHELLIAV